MHEREWEYEQVEECNHHTAAGYLGDLLDFCAASTDISQAGRVANVDNLHHV